MAKLKRNIIGFVTGTLGDLVFKVRLGKPYVCTLPLKRKASKSEIAAAARNQFRFATAFSTALYRNFIIRTLWDSSDVKGESARNKIMSVNSKKSTWGQPLRNYKLAPGDNLFEAAAASTEWEEEFIRFTVSPLNIPETAARCPVISANGLIYLTGTADPSEKQTKFLNVSSDAVPFIKGEPLEFIIHLNADDREAIEMYTNHNVLISLVLHDKNRKPVRGSVTVTF